MCWSCSCDSTFLYKIYHIFKAKSASPQPFKHGDVCMFSPLLLKGETQVCLLSYCSFHLYRHLVKRLQWSREYARLPHEPVEIAHKSEHSARLYLLSSQESPGNTAITGTCNNIIPQSSFPGNLHPSLLSDISFAFCRFGEACCPNAAISSHVIWELPEDLVVSSEGRVP